jgi:hypothetical protein
MCCFKRNAIPIKVAIAIVLVLGFSTMASAHCEVGNRIFTATLTFDDPCVNDELAFPTISGFGNGDNPSAQELQIGGEYTKTITEYFGVSLGEVWTDLKASDDSSHEGFDNLRTIFKYQFTSDAPAELAMAASLKIDWGGTGSRSIGAQPFMTLTPAWLAGQGFGFLPESMKFLRPIGLTTQLGYSFPTASSTTTFDGGLITNTHNPQFLVWGGSFQYSMPYLKSRVQDLGLSAFVNHLVPVVELNLETQTSNFDGGERTTGTVGPGVVYIGDKAQLGVEAIVPVNRASGDGVGVIAQLDIFLDDAFPHSPLFRPIFSGTPSKPDQ